MKRCDYTTHCIIFITFLSTSSQTKLDSGPYYILVKAVNNSCSEKPSKPYEQPPSAVFYTYVHNKVLIGGNITIFKSHMNYKLNVKVTVLSSGKKEAVFLLKNMSCRNMILISVLTTLGHKFTEKICKFPKGTYSFSGLDINKLIPRSLKKTLEYDDRVAKVEVVTLKDTVACAEVYYAIVPRDSRHLH